MATVPSPASCPGGGGVVAPVAYLRGDGIVASKAHASGGQEHMRARGRMRPRAQRRLAPVPLGVHKLPQGCEAVGLPAPCLVERAAHALRAAAPVSHGSSENPDDPRLVYKKWPRRACKPHHGRHAPALLSLAGRCPRVCRRPQKRVCERQTSNPCKVLIAMHFRGRSAFTQLRCVKKTKGDCWRSNNGPRSKLAQLTTSKHNSGFMIEWQSHLPIWAAKLLFWHCALCNHKHAAAPCVLQVARNSEVCPKFLLKATGKKCRYTHSEFRKTKHKNNRQAWAHACSKFGKIDSRRATTSIPCFGVAQEACTAEILS